MFPALLPLTYIPTLLSRTKQLFLSLFQPYLQSLVDSLAAGSNVMTDASATALSILRQKLDEERWSKIFDRCLRSCEESDNRKPLKTPVSLQRQAQLTAAASGASSTSHSRSEDPSADVRRSRLV